MLMWFNLLTLIYFSLHCMGQKLFFVCVCVCVCRKWSPI